MLLHSGMLQIPLCKCLTLVLTKFYEGSGNYPQHPTRLVHCIAGLQSLVNHTIILSAAKKCPSKTVSLIYMQASEEVSTFIGHNNIKRENFVKHYSNFEFLCGDFVHLVRCNDFRLQITYSAI